MRKIWHIFCKLRCVLAFSDELIFKFRQNFIEDSTLSVKMAEFAGNLNFKRSEKCELLKKLMSTSVNFEKYLQELSREHLLAQIGFDTAENEPSKIVLVYGLIPNILN